MLKVSDFPRDQYSGYFEVREAYHNTKAEVDKLAEMARILDSAGLTQLISLRKELEKYKPGDWIARVYAKAPAVSGEGLAKEHSTTLFAEYVGPEDKLDSFVKSQMLKLKKVV